MTAVPRGMCVETGKITNHSKLRPPTDVMAITSLPQDSPATGHPGLPPVTRNEIH